MADPVKTVEFLHANPDVVFDLLSRVFKGTDTLLKRLVLATSDMASNRLIYELLLECYRFGDEFPDSRRVIKVKQSILASRSGLARETISRELQKLVQQKLIIRTKQGMIIDTKVLEHKIDVTF